MKSASSPRFRLTSQQRAYSKTFPAGSESGTGNTSAGSSPASAHACSASLRLRVTRALPSLRNGMMPSEISGGRVFPSSQAAS